MEVNAARDGMAQIFQELLAQWFSYQIATESTGGVAILGLAWKSNEVFVGEVLQGKSACAVWSQVGSCVVQWGLLVLMRHASGVCNSAVVAASQRQPQWLRGRPGISSVRAAKMECCYLCDPHYRKTPQIWWDEQSVCLNIKCFRPFLWGCGQKQTLAKQTELCLAKSISTVGRGSFSCVSPLLYGGMVETRYDPQNK